MALSGFPQELKDLFSWNPPELFRVPRPRPGKKISKNTREPAFFDRHFDGKLKLLHVRHLPTLVHDIAATVDKTISDGVQFPPSDAFYSATQIARTLTNIEASVVDEKEVASFYERTTATFCLPVASSLALGFPGLLRWSQSSNVTGYAIADGFLYFPDPNRSAAMYAQLEQNIGEETVKLIRLLGENRSCLATDEFKNLAAGGPEVMLSIPKLSKLPKFKWTNCDAPNCATMVSHEAERSKVNKAENMMGHDAETTPWTLDHHSNKSFIPNVQGSSENVGRRKRKRDDDSNNQSRANPSLAPGNPALPTPEGSRRSSRIAKTAQEIKSMPPPPLPVGGVQIGAKWKGKEKEVTRAKGKAQGGSDSDSDDDGEDGDSEDKDDPSYRDEHDLSALYIVQHAWAQATRADCSIIVIQSGNHEFIGIRHRGSQTLYISDLIQPHACRDPSYGKLHVGLYIAAVRDAIDRTRQGAAGSGDGLSAGPSGEGPSGGGPRGDHKDDGGSKKGRHKKPKDDSEKAKAGGSTGSGGNMMAITAHNMAAKRTLETASRRDVLLLYLQYGIYDSPAPSTFVRSSPNGQAPVLPSRKTVRNYQLNECLSMVLKSEIGHGATGEVLRGTLKVEASACVLLDVAVKLALGSERGDLLRREYGIYQLLMKSGVTAGITAPLGLFDDVGGEACALVMPYEGTPLAARPEFVLTSSYQKAVLATLKEIHKANILHGDLRLDNILVGDPSLTIIDFGRSRVCHDQDQKEFEYLQLQSLLTRGAKQNICNRKLWT